MTIRATSGKGHLEGQLLSFRVFACFCHHFCGKWEALGNAFSCLLHILPVMEFGFCLKTTDYSPHSKTGTLTIPYSPASSLLLMSPGLPHSVRLFALGTSIVFMGKMLWVDPKLMVAELAIFKSPRSFCLQKTVHTVACAVPDTQCKMITN